MRNGWLNKSLCLACAGLSMALMAVATGQTGAGAGQSEAGGVLERVQREDNRELGELIRIAVTNHKAANDQERSDIVRKVTQSYAQIKLLDQQIDQLGRKIEATAGPADMRYEMVLAKAELESKRTTELANLREIMGIIPKFPFEKKPIPSLNAWLRLNVVDQRIVVLDGVKGGFSGYWAMARHEAVGVLSEKETLDYVRGRLKDRKSLPIRIDIGAKPAAGSAAQRLHDAIIALAIETGSQMDTEVNLEVAESFKGLGCTYYLREGKIRTLYPDPVKRPDGGEKRLDSGLVDPNDLEQSILWRITLPMNVPILFRVEYDEVSSALAKRVADTIKAVVKRARLTEVVEVTGALVEPVPERAFLGRWQGGSQGEMQVIDVQPGGICQVTMGRGTEAIKAGAHVTGTWLPTTKEIIIDIKDKAEGQGHRVYRGVVNADGNLVVNRGSIYYQGSFHLYGPSETVFQKVK